MLPAHRVLLLLVLAVVAVAPAAARAAVSVTPDSIDTTGKLSPGPGTAVYTVTNDYDAFGLRFSDAGVGTAIFNDIAGPVALAWGGINPSNVVDLLAPVQARIVMPGSGGAAAQTSQVTIEAGLVTQPLLLEAFDCAGRPIGSVASGTATGRHGRSVMTLSLPGIHAFRVSTPHNDTFGVNQIDMADPTACPPPDADQDGVPDATDNCPHAANPGQADGDHDGIGDACDPLFDTDRDGVADASDNCPAVANRDQSDGDRDGIGDACDPLFDTDRDGIADKKDNCPTVANRDQADEDNDGVGDACDVLPPGNAPVVAGTTARVAQVSGAVFVKLPSGAAKSAQARAAQAAPLPGYVPLKGVAAVPVGSTVDARRGRIRLTTAATFKRSGRRARRTQAGVFTAAIFRIRQARSRRLAGSAQPATDLVLETPPGRARACAAGSPVQPLKGVVRTLSGSAKGQFRTIGASSVTTVSNAIWSVQDRCNGTLTEVGHGRAQVRDRARKRVVTVRAGQAYLARARQFGAPRRGGRKS